MSGVLPTVVYASTVAAAQAKLAADASTTDLSVQACPSLPDSTRAGWGQFYATVIGFTRQSPSWWSAASMTNQADSYTAELCAWQEKLAVVGCASANPDSCKPPPSQSEMVKLAQLGMYAVIAIAGAYGLGKVISIIPKPKQLAR